MHYLHSSQYYGRICALLHMYMYMYMTYMYMYMTYMYMYMYMYIFAKMATGFIYVFLEQDSAIYMYLPLKPIKIREYSYHYNLVQGLCKSLLVSKWHTKSTSHDTYCYSWGCPTYTNMNALASQSILVSQQMQEPIIGTTSQCLTTKFVAGYIDS